MLTASIPGQVLIDYAVTHPAENATQERIQRELIENPHYQIRRTFCTYHDGVAVLHGYVRSYYMKQVAQSVVGQMEGVARVINQIQVAPASDAGSSRQTRS